MHELKELHERRHLRPDLIVLSPIVSHLLRRLRESRTDVLLPERLQENDEDLLDGVAHLATIGPGVTNERLDALETVSIGLYELEGRVKREEELETVEATCRVGLG
jgi:hypothetical protein